MVSENGSIHEQCFKRPYYQTPLFHDMVVLLCLLYPLLVQRVVPNEYFPISYAFIPCLSHALQALTAHVRGFRFDASNENSFDSGVSLKRVSMCIEVDQSFKLYTSVSDRWEGCQGI